ncbi:hypothetical protein Y032_0207g2019 [Ancylostoma ceylanicum]|uniref:Uncharacterized protein n=1 Tax=Ancylostoma ceylanicum TaxID=53326 RepID=A0A016SKS8_9BILA|nr:hypothetical protein Y032_0207g2019 [Ancylostoma ceylanicum]
MKGHEVASLRLPRVNMLTHTDLPVVNMVTNALTFWIISVMHPGHEIVFFVDELAAVFLFSGFDVHVRNVV